MQHETFHFTATDNLTLFGQQWQPETTPIGLVCLVHGFGEHSGRYIHVVERMVAEGFVVVAFDQRGHGRSEGPRGHTPSYHQSLGDINTLIAEAQKRHPQLPTFLYGHSMGGNMVINYALRIPSSLLGIVSTSPLLRLTAPPATFIVRLVKFLERVWPAFAITNKFEANTLSRDPEVDRLYRADPLVHGRMSAKLFSGIHQAGEWAMANAGQLAVPLLLAHGNQDKITSFAASQEFARRAPAEVITFKEWPDFRHETHNEPEKEEVIAYYIDWLKTQLG